MLKRWHITSCPLKNLVDGATNLWTKNGATDEYYYTGTLFNHAPNYVEMGGGPILMSQLGVGSLATSTWAWHNNTIYIRLGDSTDPDTKSSGHVKCSDVISVAVVGETKIAVLLSLIVSNFHASTNANIWIIQSNGGTPYFKYRVNGIAASAPFALDSKVVLDSDDVLSIMSDNPDVCILISGDES